MSSPPLLHGFNPTLLLVLNLLGTFVFGLSGGMAGVRAQLDLFGAVVLAVVVGIAGGTIRDLLIGTPPATFRDWRYLAVAGGAGLMTSLAHPAINRLQRPLDVLCPDVRPHVDNTGHITARPVEVRDELGSDGVHRRAKDDRNRGGQRFSRE